MAVDQACCCNSIRSDASESQEKGSAEHNGSPTTRQSPSAWRGEGDKVSGVNQGAPGHASMAIARQTIVPSARAVVKKRDVKFIAWRGNPIQQLSANPMAYRLESCNANSTTTWGELMFTVTRPPPSASPGIEAPSICVCGGRLSAVPVCIGGGGPCLCADIRVDTCKSA